MESRVKVVRIFVASPGDVTEERSLFYTVIEKIKQDNVIRNKVVFQVVAWDNPTGGAPLLAGITPQDAIQKGLPKPSECDIVLVIIWARMGTPLPREYSKPDGSQYLSGTEYEYLDALGSFQKCGKPLILVYRKTREPMIGLRDPDRNEKIRQWERVEDFFTQFTNPDGSIKHGWIEYMETRDFQEQLQKDLKSLTLRLLEQPDSLAPYTGEKVVSTEVNSLLAEFKRSDTTDSRKIAIVDSLSSFGEIAVPALVEALASTNLMFDMSGLGKIIHLSLNKHKQTAIEETIDFIKRSKDSAVKCRLIQALGQFGEKSAAPVLKEVLGEPVPEDVFSLEIPQVEAAKSLSRINDSSAVPNLVKALSSPNANLRAAAADALGNIGDKTSVKHLISALRDNETGVQVAAAKALGLIGDPSAVPSLQEVMKQKIDPNDFIIEDPRFEAAKALGKLRDSKSAPLAARLLAEKGSMERADVIGALALMNNPTVVPEVAKLIDDKDQFVRSEVIKTLGVLADPKGVPALRHSLEQEDDDAGEIIKALERIGGDAAAEAISMGLKSRDNFTRSRVISSLSRVGGNYAIASLVKALSDKEADVRDDATRGLLAIGTTVSIKSLCDHLSNPRNFSTIMEAEDADIIPYLEKSNQLFGKFGKVEEAAILMVAASKLEYMDENDRKNAVLVFKNMPNMTKAILDILKKDDDALYPAALNAIELFSSPSIIPELARLLSSTNRAWRLRAINALGQIKAVRSVELLAGAMADFDEEIRRDAIAALGQTGLVEALPHIKKALRDASKDVRLTAIWALGRMNDKSLYADLLGFISDGLKDIRVAAINALGEIGNTASAKELLRRLEQCDKDETICIVNALGSIGESNSATPILDLAQSRQSDKDVLSACIRALGKVKNPTALPFIISMLQHDDSNIRSTAVTALGESGSAAAVPHLIECLKDSRRYGLWEGKEALAKIGGTDALNAAIALINSTNDDSVRREALDVLGKIKDKRAIPFLCERLTRTETFEQLSIVEALGQIGDPSIAPHLINCINKNDELFSMHTTKAIKILGELGDVAAVPCLIGCLRGEDDNTRREAAQALKKIGSAEALRAIEGLPRWYLQESDSIL